MADHANTDALSHLPVGPDATFDGEEHEADIDTAPQSHQPSVKFNK